MALIGVPSPEGSRPPWLPLGSPLPAHVSLVDPGGAGGHRGHDPPCAGPCLTILIELERVLIEPRVCDPLTRRLDLTMFSGMIWSSLIKWIGSKPGSGLRARQESESRSRSGSKSKSRLGSEARVDRSAALARRKRDVGIADQCCNYGCTWEQLNEFCAVSTNSESSLDALEAHLIADRSVEETTSRVPTMISAEGTGSSASGPSGNESGRRGRGEVGRSRSGGYGHGHGSSRGGDRDREHVRTRGRRCWCRRKRRAGRRRSSLMGNMRFVSNAPRAAPVVGTVSPLLSWGRTLHAELPPREHDRFAYVTV
ncbi:hypothetical protein EVAR_59399_1 [Eumeta japonica]|uniref:Insulin-like domain-containing protein n=1 Tax=Eumeta variegata TaxID=151549 RepID=A0A4C1YHW4_EUMVA|nr:hypothetical protein EVAR_59399_1 [Eumeta japonica]